MQRAPWRSLLSHVSVSWISYVVPSVSYSPHVGHRTKVIISDLLWLAELELPFPSHSVPCCPVWFPALITNWNWLICFYVDSTFPKLKGTLALLLLYLQGLPGQLRCMAEQMVAEWHVMLPLLRITTSRTLNTTGRPTLMHWSCLNFCFSSYDMTDFPVELCIPEV